MHSTLAEKEALNQAVKYSSNSTILELAETFNVH